MYFAKVPPESLSGGRRFAWIGPLSGESNALPRYLGLWLRAAYSNTTQLIENTSFKLTEAHLEEERSRNTVWHGKGYCFTAALMV